MTRLAYRLYCWVAGRRAWALRRLTPAGRLAGLGMALAAALGADLEQSVGAQGAAVLLGLLAVSLATAGFFRGRFAVERALPRLASVGQPLVYRVTVRNLGPKPWRDLELVEKLPDEPLSFEEFMAQHVVEARRRSFRLEKSPPRRVAARRLLGRPWAMLPWLPAQGQAEARLEILPLRRGPLRFDGLYVARRDPLGLVRALVQVPTQQTVLVLPRRFSLPRLGLPGARQYQQGGVALASSVGESEEFVALRDYRAGDPLRRVHWRSSARTGRWVVKEFADEFFLRHALVLDTFAGADQAEAFEDAVSLAASFAFTLDTQESLLDLMFVGPKAVCFTTGRGVGHAEQALEILAGVQPCRDRSFAALQALVLEHAARLSGCICIFLGWDAPRRALAERLRALGLPLWVMVVVDAEEARRIKEQPEADRLENFLVLVAGQVEAGLQAWKSQRAGQAPAPSAP